MLKYLGLAVFGLLLLPSLAFATETHTRWTRKHLHYRLETDGTVTLVQDHLDPGLEAVFVPPPVEFKEAGVIVSAKVEKQGNSYRMRRHWGVDSPTMSCPASQYQAVRAAMYHLDRALNVGLVFVKRKA